MGYVSKRLKVVEDEFAKNEIYSLDKAIEKLAKAPKTKFDETVEMHFHLNIDPKNTEQMIRGTVILPHGTGKKVRIAVFCKGDNAQKAKELGADYVGAEDLIDKVSSGFLDFDRTIATPDIMRDLSRLGKILGPRGLMPSPKSGTVTNDIPKAIDEVKAGKIQYKSDKQGGIHVGIGKRSFELKKIQDNAQKVFETINHAKPGSIKGVFLKSLYLTTTMGPSVKVSV